MILENGLLVTLAFLDGKPGLTVISMKLQVWLHDEKARIPWGDNPPGDLAARLRVSGLDVFRLACDEALRYSNWLKRWAQAYPPPEQSARQVEPKEEAEATT